MDGYRGFLHGKGHMLTRSASLWETTVARTVRVEADGFLHESFQEYALKDYCSTGVSTWQATGDSRLMILDICT
jgi:hypothetical protein